MRAYLAVLKDSLREAMASRVLWVALLLIAIVLLALAPFALRTDVATELRRRELTNAERFVRDLDAGKDNDQTPAGHIWSLLSDEQRDAISDLLKEDGSRSRRRRSPRFLIVNNINNLLKRDDFYDEKAWQGIELDGDAEAQIARATNAKKKLAARNLRLLVAAFPESMRLIDSTEITLTYAGRTVAGPLPITPSELEPIVDQALVFVVGSFLGFFGVFGSLLVTASIIPRTFEPGEIALLLSKPVNRAFLFLTKFLGGCMFTLVLATTLVGGVWLLLGVRLGIWEHKLLLCIPVYVFLFAIYYSVSATAGLIWRNAVVALVLVVVFWLVLFIVGVVKAALDLNVFQPAAITEIIPAGDRMFAVNGQRQLLLYNSGSREWEVRFKRDQSGMAAMLSRLLFAGTRFKPTVDMENDRILAIEQVPSRFGTRGKGRLVVGRRDGDYERESQGDVPDVATHVFIDSDGRVIIPTRTGVYEFIGQPEDQRKSQEFFNRITGGLLPTSNKKAFDPIHDPEVPNWDTEFQMAFDQSTDAIVVYSKGELHRLKVNDGKYVAGAMRDFETEDDAVLSVGGSHVTIAFADGSVRILNSETLEDVLTEQLTDGVFPRTSVTSPDGSLSAVQTHEGDLLLFDLKNQERLKWGPAEDGDVSAVAFDDAGQLYVAAGRQNINVYDVANRKLTTKFEVDGDWVTMLYDWFINPVYSVFPKPSEVDNFVQYLLTGKRSQSVAQRGPFQGGDVNLEEDRVTFDIWTPLWTSAAFVAVMLIFSCFYVSRRDF